MQRSVKKRDQAKHHVHSSGALLDPIFSTAYDFLLGWSQAWYKRQCDIRGMLAVMQNHLVSHGKLFVGPKFMASIGVAIPAREVAAGYMQANAMASFKDVARRPK